MAQSVRPAVEVPVYLTKRQSELLDYLRQTIARQGYAPSLEEMAAHFDLSSVGTVHKHLKALEEKGAIRRQWNRSRAIELVEAADSQARRVPVLGRFRDGYALGNPEGARAVSVPEEVVGGSEAFVLVVQGDDLVGQGICDGDYLIVRRASSVSDGDQAVVQRGDGHYLRVHRRQGDLVRLEVPRDPSRRELVPAGDLEVLGVVVGIQRRL